MPRHREKLNPPKWAWAAWIALLVLAAVVAVGNALDRTSRISPEYAALVPSKLQYFALEKRAVAAIDAGRAEEGEELARQLLAKRPIPAEHLADLGVAAVQAGHVETAQQALYLAASRSWREPYSQQAVITVALEEKDWEVASQRLLALWRSGVEPARLAAQTEALLADAAGRKVFVSHLGGHSEWLEPFVEWGSQNLGQSVLMEVAIGAKRNGFQFNCPALANRVSRMVTEGKFQAAANLINAACAAGVAVTPNDFAFRDLPEGSVGPYDWDLPDSGGLNRYLVSTLAGVAIEFDNSTPMKQVLGYKIAELKPGRHVVSITLSNMSNKGSRSVVLNVDCIGSDGKSSRVASAGIGGGEATFDIPKENCPAQRFALEASSGHGRLNSFSVR